MTKPLDLRLAPRLALQLRRRLRRDGVQALIAITGVSRDTLYAAAAEVPIRRASRFAIEKTLEGDGPSAPAPDLGSDASGGDDVTAE